MTDGMTPSQFQILREDFASMRSEFNQRFDNLVTRESFRDEQRRVDERFRSMGREIGDVKADLTAEASARVADTQAGLQRQLAEKAEREKVRRATGWQWLFLAVSLVVGPVLGALIGSAMTLTGVNP